MQDTNDARVTRNWKYKSKKWVQCKNNGAFQRRTISSRDDPALRPRSFNSMNDKQKGHKGWGWQAGQRWRWKWKYTVERKTCLSPRFSINSSSCLSTILRLQSVSIMKYVFFFSHSYRLHRMRGDWKRNIFNSLFFPYTMVLLWESQEIITEKFNWSSS